MSELTDRLRDESWTHKPRHLNTSELRVWHNTCCEAADLIDALWECFESAQSATKNDYHWTSKDGIERAVRRVEELTK